MFEVTLDANANGFGYDRSTFVALRQQMCREPNFATEFVHPNDDALDRPTHRLQLVYGCAQTRSEGSHRGRVRRFFRGRDSLEARTDGVSRRRVIHGAFGEAATYRSNVPMRPTTR
jgi:hypothetical protein